METFIVSLLQFFFLAALISWGLGKMLPTSQKTTKLVGFVIADMAMFSGALSLVALVVAGLHHFVALNTQPSQQEEH